MKINKPFRLKDTKTGLYYIPIRHIMVEGKSTKSNLSKTGKIYFSDPRKHIIYIEDHTVLEDGRPTLRKDIESLEIEYLKLD